MSLAPFVSLLIFLFVHAIVSVLKSAEVLNRQLCRTCTSIAHMWNIVWFTQKLGFDFQLNNASMCIRCLWHFMHNYVGGSNWMWYVDVHFALRKLDRFIALRYFRKSVVCRFAPNKRPSFYPCCTKSAMQ